MSTEEFSVRILLLPELHVVHAVHYNPGKNHGKTNSSVADPKDLQTNPAHNTGPIVYSCGIRGTSAASGRVLHKKADPSFLMSSLAAPIVSALVVATGLEPVTPSGVQQSKPVSTPGDRDSNQCRNRGIDRKAHA